jgi:imidazolonepropionase-like amidohydrolase
VSLVLTNATVIDGTGRDPVAGGVTIDGGRIGAVGATSPGPAATVLDAGGLTVLPGLIDLHTHLGVIAIGAPESLPPAVAAAHMFRNAELCLMSGHTSVREVGGADGGLVQAIDLGLVTGPRVFPSGPLLCQSGGHGDYLSAFFAHEYHHDPGVPGLAQMSLVCDGPEEVRVAARTAFRRGATQLKMCLSGGVVSLTDSLEDTQFTVEELRAAVAEAAARGTYVTAHAHNGLAVRNGLAAGVTCFEHGTFLDEATVAAMAAAGATLVPTLTVLALMPDKWREWGVPQEALPRLAGVMEAQSASIKMAFEAGVRIGSGSDCLGPRQSGRGRELALKAEVLGPMEAIVSATATSARVLGRDDLGVLAPGKTADIIAVDFDPLAQPGHWADPGRVVLVIKDGLVVKDTRKTAGHLRAGSPMPRNSAASPGRP